MLSRFARRFGSIRSSVAVQRRSLATRSVTVNGASYRLPVAGRPVVGVCLDGSAHEYFEQAANAGAMPNWSAITGRALSADASAAKFEASLRSAAEAEAEGGGGSSASGGPEYGHHALVSGAMPTFTNPNNVSIMTGVAPAVHGICGNYYLDTTAGQGQEREVMMTDPKLIRANSIFAALSAAGCRIVILTAKEKLRSLLSHQLQLSDAPAAAAGGAATTQPLVLSMEKVHSDPQLVARAISSQSQSFGLASDSGEAKSLRSVLSTLTPPDIYNPDISTHMIEFGARLMAHDLRWRPQVPTLYYLSSTDYLQHTYNPSSPVAHSFYRKLDASFGAYHALSGGRVTVGVTADHGMNDKVDHTNKPRIIFLQSLLDDDSAKRFDGARVILPITDPYVRHHAALGSFATVYLSRGSDGSDEHKLQAAMDVIRRTPGVYTVMNRAEAARAFELSADRIGDIIVVADTHTVLGRRPADHDLSHLDGTLRSHGGLSEATVPMFISRPLTRDYAQRLNAGRARNYHLFDFLCNGLA